MCANKPVMNHSLCCVSVIWEVSWSINTLNLWSKSHMNSPYYYLISLISVIHWDSNFDFWNSLNINSSISSSVLPLPGGAVASKFIYHVYTRSQKFVSNREFLHGCQQFAWLTKLHHTQTNVYGSSFPFPWNKGNFNIESSLTMVIIMNSSLSSSSIPSFGIPWLSTLGPLFLFLSSWSLLYLSLFAATTFSSLHLRNCGN